MPAALAYSGRMGGLPVLICRNQSELIWQSPELRTGSFKDVFVNTQLDGREAQQWSAAADSLVPIRDYCF